MIFRSNVGVLLSPTGDRVMSSNSRLSPSLMWDWPALIKGSLSNPFGFVPAPPSFEQSILPGWVFGDVTITEQNSSAPDTERAIVGAQSYGRQLGRITDALALLIAGLPETDQHAKAFEEFARMREEVNDIKIQAASRRLDRVAADLAALKETKPEESERLAAKLRAALSGG
jgi:hypothetical protein